MKTICSQKKNTIAFTINVSLADGQRKNNSKGFLNFPSAQIRTILNKSLFNASQMFN